MVNHERLVLFAQELVRASGLSGDEAASARLVEHEMRALGYDHVEVDALGGVIGVINGTHNQGAQAGQTILLDAHTDTVGISPGVPWTHDPYGGAIHNDAIYGRGSADMKGALAAMVHGIAALDRSQLRGRVVVSASTMEEVLEGVALRAVMDAYPPDCVIIGEPSSLNLVHGGRGRAELHLTTTGTPSHSSSPHLGRNAVLDMMRVIAAVEALPMRTDPVLGSAVIALTDIVSDPYPGNSMIPSQCRVTYDRRLIAGDTAESVVAEIVSLPDLQDITLDVRVGTGRYAAYTGAQVEVEKYFPAWLLERDHPLVQGARKALQDVGQQPNLETYRFCTNAAWSAGGAGIPTIGYGPSSEPEIHVVDEHLRIADLIAAAEGYGAIVGAVLG